LERDGREIGGMPGIKYQWCEACGWSRAITKTGRKRATPSPAVLERANRLGVNLNATNARNALAGLIEAPADVDARLDQIAREHLRLETLATRKSDSLDFHDLAVWQIRDALRAAYDAGRASAK
jgi:hypothetical protein